MTVSNSTGKGRLRAPLQTADQAADELHQRIRSIVSTFVFEQRVRAGMHTHEPFTRILEEHAASLEDIRGVLLEALARDGDIHVIRCALDLLTEETKYVRALAGEEQK